MLKILSILLLLCGSWAQAADLAWNASVVDEQHAAPDGYRIHWGSEPGVYTGQSDAGNELVWHIPDDWYGQYYFAASAYNSAGQSGYSNEVIFTRDQPQQHIGATGLTASRYQVEEQMALSTPTLKYNGYSAGGFGTGAFTTSAFTPANNSLLIVFVTMKTYSESSDVSGSLSISDSVGLSWSKPVSHGNAASWAFACAIFVANVGTGQSMTVSIDCGSYSAYSYSVCVAEVTGHDTTTPTGATASDNSLATDGSDSITLSGSPSSDSYVYGLIWKDWDGPSSGLATVLHGTGWTELLDISSDTGHARQIQYRTSSISNSVAWDDVESGGYYVYKAGAIAVEIKAASGGTSAVPVIMRSYRARRN